MIPNQLRHSLEALGWRTDEQHLVHSGNECRWYAWAPREMRKTPTDCACNDKPPSLAIEPFSFEMNGVQHSSVTFRLTGELPSSRWVDFRVYSVDMDECVQEIDAAKAVLLGAWEAACATCMVENSH